MTTTTTLLGLLQLEGDDAAWHEFVTRHQPILVAVGLRLGLGEHDAVDVAQQTLLEFVRDLRSGRYDRTRDRLRNALMAIAEHRVRDHQRVLARNVGVMNVGGVEPLANVTDALKTDVLEQLWEAEERRVLLREAMLRLRAETNFDERTVRAFELTALRSVPVELVAQECGMTVSQVYVARSRAATRLREIVSQLEALYAIEGVA